MATIAFDENLIEQTLTLSDGAFRFYIDAVCWVVRQQTAGFVPEAYARTRMSGSRYQQQAQIQDLVGAGLFRPARGGWDVLGPWHVTSGGRRRIREEVRRAVFDADGNVCRECGATDGLTIDHIYPRSRAGSDSRRNLQTLCGPCNSRKAAKV